MPERAAGPGQPSNYPGATPNSYGTDEDASNNVTTSNGQDASGEYLDLLFGDRSGAVCLRFGRDPHWDEGRYKHRKPDPTAERGYVWPGEREQLLRDVADEVAAGSDVWVCPALRSYKPARVDRSGDEQRAATPRRRKKGAAPPS